MDPSSLSSSIFFTIEAVGKATIAAHKYGQSVRDAPESRTSLLQELSAIGNTLKRLKVLTDELSAGDPTSSTSSIGAEFDPKSSKSTSIRGKRRDAMRQLSGEEEHLQRLQTTLDDILKWLDRVGAEKMTARQRLFWPLRTRQSKIKEFIQELERYKTHFTLVLSMVSIETLDELQSLSTQVMAEQQRIAQLMEQDQNSQKRQQLVEWLEPVQYNIKHDDSSRLRQAGTCAWLLEEDLFVHWRSEAGFLWLHGIPGSGKTILASSVIDELKNNQNDMTVVYHYFDFSDSRSTTPVTMLRSIFIQLLLLSKVDWMDDFSDLAARKERHEGPPTGTSKLIELIARASRYHNRVTVVVDALDECKTRAEVLEVIRELHRGHFISIFVTSRKEQDIYEAFSDLPYISLKNHRQSITEDMRKHVSNELLNRRKLAKLSDELKEEILNILLANAHGMFRWIQCQLDAVGACRTPKGIREALSNLPKGLNQTYERILQNILSQGEEVANIAQKALMWLIGSTRPLLLSELQDAIMIEVDGVELDLEQGVFEATEILEICGSFVDNFQEEFVRLSHYTVKEFLQTGSWTDKTLSRFHFSSAKVHTDLAILTLSYLLFNVFNEEFQPSFETIRNRAMVNSFLIYAVTHLHTHVGRSMSSDDVYIRLQNLFANPSNHYSHLTVRGVQNYAAPKWGITSHHDGIEGPETLFWYAISYGHTWVVQRMLRENPNIINAGIASGGGPLMLAVLNGHLEVVNTLLDLGADINISHFAWNGSSTLSPIIIAAQMGNEQVFNTLVERGARLDVRSVPSMQTVLHASASTGKLPIMQTLLRHGVDPNAIDSDGATALHVAVSGNQLETVRLLTEAGCDPRLKTKSNRTPLHIAFDLQAKPMIAYLLSLGADLADLGPLYEEQVRWASSEPWYSTLMLREDDNSLLVGTQSDKIMSVSILEVRDLFQKRLKLPSDIVNIILDMAEYWAHSIAICNDEVCVTERDEQRPYVSIKAKTQSPACVRRIVFTTKSHDQGWSGEPHNHGTYNHTWTWFEAMLTRSTFLEGDTEPPRRDIQRNVHGSLASRIHINTWDYLDDLPDLKGWLKSINPGDSISVIPRAAFAGWENHVDFVRIDLYCAW